MIRSLKRKCSTNNGELYKNTGDGYQAAFVNAPEALKAALDIQRKLSSAAWQGNIPIRVRIGLAYGRGRTKLMRLPGRRSE